jgi:hypothetical protein
MSYPVAAVAPSASATPTTAAAPAAKGHAFNFHELLSELNPLQYIPVVGTIYRSVTGDTIPQAALTIGSLVVSGLAGGPVGLAIGAASVGLEQVTGINPETIGHNLLASIGIGNEDPAVASPIQTATAPTPAGVHSVKATSVSQSPTVLATAPAAATLPNQGGWTAAQLSAYGITSTPDGTLQQGSLVGSDVLNQLVLASVAPTVMEAGSATSPAVSG